MGFRMVRLSLASYSGVSPVAMHIIMRQHMLHYEARSMFALDDARLGPVHLVQSGTQQRNKRNKRKAEVLGRCAILFWNISPDSKEKVGAHVLSLTWQRSRIRYYVNTVIPRYKDKKKTAENVLLSRSHHTLYKDIHYSKTCLKEYSRDQDFIFH